ncbi:MAG: c-type cytochrome [Pseudomonadales bacterium]|nr:c-type cytochrome [Pseudomonadales bacterium]
MAPVGAGKLLTVMGMAVLLLGGRELAAQEHSYAPADIEAGQGVYQANCLGCHGDKGDAVEGANLSTGRFRRGSTDEDLIRVIRTGIPNTLMPPHTTLSTGQIRTAVAFLRTLPTRAGVSLADEREVRVGNAARGRTLFEGRAQCSSCHGVNSGGALLSPDLGSIGAQRSPGALELSLLEPNAEVRAGDRFFEVSIAGGATVSGKLLNQDTHSVQLLNNEEKLVSYFKSELDSYGFIASPMPSYRDLLTADQVADLVAYMLTLRGENAQ